MYELKELERSFRINLLGPGSCLIKREFTGPRSDRGWETLVYTYNKVRRRGQTENEK